MTPDAPKKRNLTHPRFAEERTRQAERLVKMQAMDVSPNYNRSDIARAFGISRERVRQVLGNKGN